mgnify:CR=1 FL=1
MTIPKIRPSPTAKLLFLIIVIGLLFRLYHLSGRDLWYAEVLSVLQSQRNLPQIFKEVSTPLHYIILHFFLYFGKNSFILGLPSVLLGIGSIILLFLITRRFATTSIALLTSLLFAISPMHIEFSQQILHFSYLIFFTLLALLFYIDFLLSLTKRIRWISLFCFIISSLLNLLTQPVALLILAIEGINFGVFFLTHPQLIRRHIKYISIGILLFLVSFIPLLRYNGGYYLHLLETINIANPNSVQLGYSLSKHLGSNLLTFSPQFFIAMFSWFGIGYDIRFNLFFILAIFGTVSQIIYKRFTWLFLTIIWISFPFVYLYFFRINHWFEEKYFIFIIPIYLQLVGTGIEFLCSLISIRNTFWKIRLELIFATLILFIAWNPITTRTNYGFPIPNDTVYSYKAVHTYFAEHLYPRDKVFIRQGEGLFFDYYFPASYKNNVWFEEADILSLSPQEYLSLINNPNKCYFVSIPEFYDSFLAFLADGKYIAKIGNFNIYEIKFIKNNPFVIEPTNGSWEYYDDYKTAKFLSDSKAWENITIVYSGNYNFPVTYGYYDLSPVNHTTAWIDYQFIMPAGDFYIRPVFSLGPETIFKISIGDNTEEMTTVYEQTASQTTYFSPNIKIKFSLFTPGISIIRFSFEFSPNRENISGDTKLKSILITNKEITGASEFENLTYDAHLEVVKSHDWQYSTVVNYGWIQSFDGALFNLYGDPETSPLIYRFDLPPGTQPNTLNLKTYSFDNTFSVYISYDNVVWNTLSQFRDNEVKEHLLNLSSYNRPINQPLYVKFICRQKGHTCELKGLQLTLKQISKSNE